MKLPLTTSKIQIKPSENLRKFIKDLKYNEKMPLNIKYINCKISSDQKQDKKITYSLLNVNENSIEELIKSNEDLVNNESFNFVKFSYLEEQNIKGYLTVDDIRWLYDYIQQQKHPNKTYLHELIEGCEICLPKNVIKPRDPILEKRCEKLKNQQDNLKYYSMTKNVDNTRLRFPEDTISYQMKQINRQLIAVFQFVISILTGFAFGFIGIELMVGELDLGFRLLLGVMFAIIVALAEIYFLAKKLNEEEIIESVLSKNLGPIGASKINKPKEEKRTKLPSKSNLETKLHQD